MKLKSSNLLIYGVIGFVGIVAIDHFVLKGKLGIAGHFNKLIGQLKKMAGQGAGPIEPASLGGMAAPEPRTPEEQEESFANEMEIEAEHLAQFPD